jgi:hypothetical protein
MSHRGALSHASKLFSKDPEIIPNRLHVRLTKSVDEMWSFEVRLLPEHIENEVSLRPYRGRGVSFRVRRMVEERGRNPRVILTPKDHEFRGRRVKISCLERRWKERQLGQPFEALCAIYGRGTDASPQVVYITPLSIA